MIQNPDPITRVYEVLYRHGDRAPVDGYNAQPRLRDLDVGPKGDGVVRSLTLLKSALSGLMFALPWVEAWHPHSKLSIQHYRLSKFRPPDIFLLGSTGGVGDTWLSRSKKMPKTNLHPRTLTGIKTLAHDLKVQTGVTHTAGLDLAAGLAGFPNYKAALKRLGKAEGDAPPPRFPLFISIWWRDPSTRASGRETVRIETGRPLDELFPLKTMRHARYLSGMKRAGPDHLVYRVLNAGQGQARIEAAGAARTIAFIEATGLVPSGASRKEYPKGEEKNALPGHDHTGVWQDAETKAYVITDEPYTGASREARYSPDRAAWAEKWDMDLRPVDWGGMYYPDGGSRLFVFTDAKGGYDLGKMVARLNGLATPLGSIDWTGESARAIFEFVTPGMIAELALKAAAKALRPKPEGRSGPRNSVTYHATFGDRRSRPAAKLPLSTHERMGELLKAALGNINSFSRPHDQLGRIRSELEDWLAGEYPSTELDRDTFLQVYYKELKDKRLVGTSGRETELALSQIDEVRGTLVTNYPDSAPLRAMLAKLDKVRGHLTK